MRDVEIMPAGSGLGFPVITEPGSKRERGERVPAVCEFNVGSCVKEMQPLSLLPSHSCF